jgi:hypothetical protein
MTVSISPPTSSAADLRSVPESTAPQVPSRADAVEQPVALAKADTVELSDRALAAEAMMSGASKAATAQGRPELDQLAQQVASGTYLPEPREVAAALTQYERRAGKGAT